MKSARLMALVCTLSIWSCHPKPERVFIPESKSTATLSIGASSVSVLSGEEILLSATREYQGSWIEVPRKSLSKHDCWMVEPPFAYKEEVAGNVRWLLKPSEAGAFNLGLRKDGKRSLIISEPGSYELSATTSVWCGEPVRSRNRIRLEIRSG